MYKMEFPQMLQFGKVTWMRPSGKMEIWWETGIKIWM